MTAPEKWILGAVWFSCGANALQLVQVAASGRTGYAIALTVLTLMLALIGVSGLMAIPDEYEE